MRIRSVFAIATASLAVASFAQEPQFGVRVGYSAFSSGEMRDALGSGRISFGIGRSPKTYGQKLRIDTDLDFSVQNRNGNRLLLIPFTVGVATDLSEDLSGGAIPYVAARVGLAYMDYAITRPSTGQRFNATKIAPTANLEVGVRLQRNMTLAARYNMFQKNDGFDFNGFQINLTYTFFKF